MIGGWQFKPPFDLEQHIDGVFLNQNDDDESLSNTSFEPLEKLIEDILLSLLFIIEID